MHARMKRPSGPWILELKPSRALAGLVVGWLMATTACAAAPRKPVPCQVTTESKISKDRSVLKIITRDCEHTDRREFDIQYSPRVGQPTRTVGRGVQTISQYFGGEAVHYDWDKDGQYEILVTGSCFNVNCDKQLLRVDRRSGRLQQVARGFGVDMLPRHGYLVISGRDSCCAWAEEAYRIIEPHVSVAAAPSFSIIIPNETDDEPRKPITCLYPSPSGAGQVVEHVLPLRVRNGLVGCDAHGRRHGLLKPPAADQVSLEARLPVYRLIQGEGVFAVEP